MDEILWRGVKHETVPENFICPPEMRPKVHVKSWNRVPVIQLSGGDRREISAKILDAGKEFGFFQVVDHGVSEQVINDMMEVGQEFFDMRMEDKVPYYSEDQKKFPRLFTSIDSNFREIRFWRDCLRLVYHGPGDEFMHLYPGKPSRFKNVAAEFGEKVEELGTRILSLISEGLGLGDGYFSENFNKGPVNMNVNHYPTCPDPSLTLGLPKHCDPNLITLLLQGNVGGLQVLHDGEWLQVDPTPNAFVVNFGYVLEIITNGLLKSVEHRVVTNTTVARTTIAAFFTSAEDCLLAPARSLIPEHQNPPLYKSFPFTEFARVFMANQGDRERMIDALRNKN